MKIITPQELASAVELVAPWMAPKLDDSSFAVPAKDWVLGAFCDLCARNFLKQAPKGYRRNQTDCENWVVKAINLANDCHSMAEGCEAGLTMGEYHYRTDQGGGHAIMLAVVDSVLEPIFLEVTPPIGWPLDYPHWKPHQITLSQPEMESCEFTRFC